MERDFSCGVIPVRLTDGQRQYLLIQHHAGHWGFPKGHPEPGESDAEAAARELAEETGLTDAEILDQPTFDEHYVFMKKGGQKVHKTVRYFIGRVSSGEVIIQPEEVADFFWGNAGAAREKLTFEEGRKLLDAAETYFQEHP